MLNALFGCRHKHYSWPRHLSIEGELLDLAYVACLDCGAELEYDLVKMAVGGRIDDGRRTLPSQARVATTEHAV